MIGFDINWLALVVAVVAAQVLGFLWYGTMLFGNAWVAAQGKKMEDFADAGIGGYIYAMLAAAVMFFVLANVLNWTGAASIGEAMTVGFIMWLGFQATMSALNTSFEQRSWNLWAINNGYQLVNILVGSIIFTLMA